VEIVREVSIERPVEFVFAFVADARNDPRWCPKVRSVAQVSGDGPGPDARYAVVHKPVPGKPARQMEMTCAGYDPPRRIEWREDDGTDLFEVVYKLEDRGGGGGTLMRQTSRATIGAPRLLHGLYRIGIGRDIARQLKALKKVLEKI
jgi:uncharacterized protein YndB with AHSA1/START domain